MEKELKIEIPQGYKIDRQNSTFEKIVFIKIEHCKPKTWEDYCFLTEGKTVYHTNCNYIIVRSFQDAHNMFATKERANQFVALGKLLQLRDYWVKGYSEFKYAVYGDRLDGTAICDLFENTNHPLTFPTKEMAEEFKECFPDLLKKAFLLE